MEFEWDLSKELENIRKHGITFADAVESFFDKHGFLLVDNKHSVREKRYYWVGRIMTGRVLTTRFTRRGSKIRIIGSAEWRKFRRLYHARTKTQSSQDR
ncbi:MAG: BrnT family toxin [Nitrospira sp.]|nr:MAG: BrnT family toxin [Nitrospira sp.]